VDSLGSGDGPVVRFLKDRILECLNDSASQEELSFKELTMKMYIQELQFLDLHIMKLVLTTIL
jgi:hypothetical protein